MPHTHAVSVTVSVKRFHFWSTQLSLRNNVTQTGRNIDFDPVRTVVGGSKAKVTERKWSRDWLTVRISLLVYLQLFELDQNRNFEEKVGWIKSETVCITWLTPSYSELDQKLFTRVIHRINLHLIYFLYLFYWQWMTFWVTVRVTFWAKVSIDSRQ